MTNGALRRDRTRRKRRIAYPATHRAIGYIRRATPDTYRPRLAPTAQRIQRHPVQWRRHRPRQQRIARLAHPTRELCE